MVHNNFSNLYGKKTDKDIFFEMLNFGRVDELFFQNFLQHYIATTGENNT